MDPRELKFLKENYLKPVQDVELNMKAVLDLIEVSAWNADFKILSVFQVKLNLALIIFFNELGLL